MHSPSTFRRPCASGHILCLEISSEAVMYGSPGSSHKFILRADMSELALRKTRRQMYLDIETPNLLCASAPSATRGTLRPACGPGRGNAGPPSAPASASAPYSTPPRKGGGGEVRVCRKCDILMRHQGGGMRLSAAGVVSWVSGRTAVYIPPDSDVSRSAIRIWRTPHYDSVASLG